MSIPKLQLVTQAETAARQIATLDTTRAVVVSREQLSEAYQDTRHVSRCLHNVENIADLDYSELAYLCRTLHRTAQVLDGMLSGEGGRA